MWKIIPDTNELYFANEQGQIKSSSRIRSYNVNGKNGTYLRNGKILSQAINSHGYPCVTIKFDNGTQKVVAVHRLIAKTFIPNPENNPQINHIDGDKTNNAVSNLEWCTARDNIIHAFKNNLNKGSHHMKGKKGKFHPLSIPVVAYKKNGEFVAEYESLSIAAEKLGIKSCAHISSCINGKRKTCHNYIWKRKNQL